MSERLLKLEPEIESPTGDEKKVKPKNVSELMSTRVTLLSLVKVVWTSSADFKKYVCYSFVLAIISKLATAMCAFVIAAAVDSKIGSSTGPISLAGWSIGALGFIFVVSKSVEALLAPLQMFAGQRAEAYVESRLLDQAFGSLLALPKTSWNGVEINEATARMNVRDPLKHFVFCVFRWAIPTFIEIIFSCSALWILGMGPASVVVVISGASFVILSLTLSPWLERLAKESTVSRGKSDSTVARLFSSIELARAYDAREAFSQARVEGAKRAARYLLDVTKAVAYADALAWLALVVGSAFAMWIGASALSSGAATAGGFAAMMSVSGLALVGMKNLSFAFSSIAGASSALAFPVNAIHEAKRLGLSLNFSPQRPPASPSRLSIKNLNVVYPGQTKKSITDFSIELSPGEKVWLVGASGAGKTTLIRALCGWVELDSGRVAYGTHDLLSTDAPAAIALMSQEPDALSTSVRVNLLLGKANANDEQMWNALCAAGLDQKIQSMGGLDAKASGDGHGLSGGEASRLSLARALVSERPLLLLDEPTASLDPATERAVLSSLMQRTEVAAIISIHRILAIPPGSRVVVMSEGKIVQDGSLEQLSSLEGHFAHLIASARK